MARLDWTTFLAIHPKAHLLAAQVPDPSAIALKRLRRQTQALIDAEGPMGDYATAIVRHDDITEIQCGFANRTDADRVGERLGATTKTPGHDWSSERTLQLDERVERALEAKSTRRRAVRLADPESLARSRI